MCYSLQKKEENEHYEDSAIHRAQAFIDGPIRTCLDHHVVDTFGGRVPYFIDKLFWSHLRRGRGNSMLVSCFSVVVGCIKCIFANHNKYRDYKADYELPDVLHNISRLTSNFIYFRSCPALMFFSEGLSKLFFLTLVAVNSERMRNPQIVNAEVNAFIPVNEWELMEIILVIMLFSSMLYEYG